jgi:hypothetical protein
VGIAQHHLQPGTDKGAGQGLADTAGRAGEKNNAAIQVGCGHLLSSMHEAAWREPARALS